MELTTGVYDLPIDTTIGDRRTTLHPVTVETPRGPLLLDVGMPDGVAELADALDSEGVYLDNLWGVAVTHQIWITPGVWRRSPIAPTPSCSHTRPTRRTSKARETS